MGCIQWGGAIRAKPPPSLLLENGIFYLFKELNPYGHEKLNT